jgi:hypothetical protein
MTGSHEEHIATLAYHGEVWTDASGRAVIVLPPEARSLTPPVTYALEPAERSVAAVVTGELEADRFTIATDEPHVKVAWRIVGGATTRRDAKRTSEDGET